MSGTLGTLGIDELSWSELFGSLHPSVVHTQSTNPHDTDISTEDTILLMNQYAYEDSSHPILQLAAREIRENARSNNDKDLAQATFDYVKSHVQFVEDESILTKLFGIDSDVELLIRPARLLSMRNPMGDCDDFSMLTKSLLLALDVDSSYITVAADIDKPQKWSHVYVLTDGDENGNSIPIDTSHGKYLGWEAQSTTREKIWNDSRKEIKRRKKDMIMDDSLGLLEGLEGLEGLGQEYDYGGEYSTDIPGSGGGYVGGSSSSGYNWSSLISPLTKAGSQIAIAQFGQPQLAPGTFIRSKEGAILTNQPINTGLFTSGGGSGINFGGSGLLIGAVVVIGGLMFFSRR